MTDDRQAGLRAEVVAAAVEWVAAHDAVSLDNPTGPADHELLERYSEACNELLAIVSQNRAALALAQVPAQPERAYTNPPGLLPGDPDWYPVAVPAQEEGLDVERLARALEPAFGPSYFPGLTDVTIFGKTPLEVAQGIAAEYRAVGTSCPTCGYPFPAQPGSTEPIAHDCEEHPQVPGSDTPSDVVP